MSYCAIEEAFMPLVPGGQTSKKSKKSRTMVVPSAPAGSDQETKDYSMATQFSTGDDSGKDTLEQEMVSKEPDRHAMRPPPATDILSTPATNGRLDSIGSSSSSSDFFPVQGNNAEPEAWQKAFLLGDMSSQVQKPVFQVDQKQTLWRSIPKQVTSAISSTSSAFVDTLAPITGPDEIGRRLESLTKQLDSLTAVSPMQNTAELFLFVAIGLLLLLAIDTLLRYATASATASATTASTPLQVMSGGGRGRGGGRSGGHRYR